MAIDRPFRSTKTPGTAHGTFSGTTDGTGKVVVTHGLGGVPSLLLVQDQNSGHYAAPANPTSTTFQVFVRNLTTAGAPVLTATAVTIYWQAAL